MDIVLLALIIAITIMYTVTQICDVLIEMFKQNKENDRKEKEEK